MLNNSVIYFLFPFSIGKWLVPPKPPRPKAFGQRLQECLPHQFSMMYIRNNRQFLSFLILFIILVNVALFVARAYYFKDFAMLNNYRPNFFYMMSRANGEPNLIRIYRDISFSETV